MKPLLLTIITFLCLTGCKTQVPLNYEPIHQKCAPNNISVTIPSFKDSRKNPKVVGSKRNAYGMPIIKIITEDNVSDWVTNALKTEMSNAGYMMTDTYLNSIYEVTGTILKVYATTYFIYHGRMSILVTIQKEGKQVFEKLYNTKISGGINWFATNKSCANTLKINLQEVCTQFIKDFNALNQSSHKE